MTYRSRIVSHSFIVVIIATLIAPKSSKAQDKEPPVSMYSSFGLSVPIASKTFSQLYRTGTGFSEGIVIRLINRLSLRTTFNYHWYNFKGHNPFFRADVYPKEIPDKISAHTVGFNVDMMFDITGNHHNVHWYSVIGPDFMSFKSGSNQYGNQQADSTLSFQSNTFGWNIGTGIRYTLTKQIQFYGEMDYQLNFEKTGTRELLPLSLGISFFLD